MTPLSGLFWRARFVAQAASLLEPARSLEGRFHHDGQRALYLSASAEGARVAMQTYLRADDPERAIYPLAVSRATIIDLTDPAAAARLDLDLAMANARWQNDRAGGAPARSWALSDAAREAGADGLLYASRKRPGLMHLVLFRWNGPGDPTVARAGTALPFSP